MIEQCDLSERRACRLVGLSRDSDRLPPEDLSGKIIEIAQVRRRLEQGTSSSVPDVGDELLRSWVVRRTEELLRRGTLEHVAGI
jgi:hypothetical protein